MGPLMLIFFVQELTIQVVSYNQLTTVSSVQYGNGVAPLSIVVFLPRKVISSKSTFFIFIFARFKLLVQRGGYFGSAISEVGDAV